MESHNDANVCISTKKIHESTKHEAMEYSLFFRDGEVTVQFVIALNTADHLGKWILCLHWSHSEMNPFTVSHC